MEDDSATPADRRDRVALFLTQGAVAPLPTDVLGRRRQAFDRQRRTDLELAGHVRAAVAEVNEAPCAVAAELGASTESAASEAAIAANSLCVVSSMETSSKARDR